MSDDMLASIDAAVADAREDVCACGCGVLLTHHSPSLYFATESCQVSFLYQQQAVADGDTERAEEMRRQRCEDPVERMHRQADENWAAALGVRPDDGRRAACDLAMTVRQAAALLGDRPLDALRLEPEHPFAYLPRCADCGRRESPMVVAAHAFGQERPVRVWHVCPHCQSAMPPAGMTATVRRSLASGGLHLSLHYETESAHMLLAERTWDHYLSLDLAWRELEAMLSTTVSLPWDRPQADPLRDVREHAARTADAGQGQVFLAPLDAEGRPGDWTLVGHTSGPGVAVEAEPSHSYHAHAGQAIDITAEPRQWRVARHFQWVMRSIRLAAEQMRHLGHVAGRAAGTLSEHDALLRAIEAKRNRQHGPQRKQRAPRRIDPTRRR